MAHVRDPFYFLGVWDSLYLCKKDPYSSYMDTSNPTFILRALQKAERGPNQSELSKTLNIHLKRTDQTLACEWLGFDAGFQHQFMCVYMGVSQN